MSKRVNTASELKRAPRPPRQRTDRSDGPCPIMRSCGGCEWLGLPYHKQLTRKHAAMIELFAPLINHFCWEVEVEPVLGMGAAEPPMGRTAVSEVCAHPFGEQAASSTCAGKARASLRQDASNAPDDAEPRASRQLPLIPPVTAGGAPLASPRGFRHKAASPFAPGKPQPMMRSGFFARGTHDIVACEACAVEAPGARELLNEAARMAQALGIPAYDEDRRCGQLRHAVVRRGWRTGDTMLTLVTRSREVPQLQRLAAGLRAAHPDLVCVAHNVNPRATNAILGGETRILSGSPCMRDELLGCAFEISPASFYQVNPQQTEVLYRLAIECMGLRPNDIVLDAYCGSGTIGLCAAATARSQGMPIRLIGVERNVAGVRDASRNAQLNGLEDTAEFIARDATEFMLDAAAKSERTNVLVMDPPRAGSTPDFIEATAVLGPRTVVYISCNPTTQARDLTLFAQKRYRLTRLAPVDLFPHTKHVETVATLTRE